MGYSLQSFSSGQIFSYVHANQMEESIASHLHGVASLLPSGTSWFSAETESNIIVSKRNAASNIKVSGDVNIYLNRAQDLGSQFGCAITNVGSGRVAVFSSSGQLIHNSSYFVVTPREAINLNSDGSNITLIGKTTGRFLLMDDRFVGSKSVNTTHRFPWLNDFDHFEFTVDATAINSLSLNPTGATLIQWSADSGSSFFSSGYEELGGGDDADPAPNQPSSGHSLIGTIQNTVAVSNTVIYFSRAVVHFGQNGPLAADGVVASYGETVAYWAGLSPNRNWAIRNFSFFAIRSPESISVRSINSFRFVANNSNAYTEIRNIRLWGVR